MGDSIPLALLTLCALFWPMECKQKFECHFCPDLGTMHWFSLLLPQGLANGQIKKGIFKVGKIDSDRWDFPKALWSHAVLFSPEVSLYTLPSFLSLPTFRNKSPSHIFIQCDDNITFWKAIWLHELGCLKIFILLELATLLCKSKENEL